LLNPDLALVLEEEETELQDFQDEQDETLKEDRKEQVVASAESSPWLFVSCHIRSLGS